MQYPSWVVERHLDMRALGKDCGLCQTNSERQFLLDYLRFVRDRQFPMLLPQVRSIAERRRPDFVLFIPMQFWHYQELAVQLDGGHRDDVREFDVMRDEHLEEHGYETLSLRPDDKGYLSEAKGSLSTLRSG